MRLKIKEAREHLGISQKELAKNLGIKQTTFNGYETGSHDPKSNVLLEIAKYCNTTVDFLLGLTNNIENTQNISENNTVSLSPEYIEKYRKLDNHSKELINMIIDKELERTETNIP